MEEVWDLLLTEGKRLYGIAVDDAHHFQGEFSPDRVNPGRGWVVGLGACEHAPYSLGAMAMAKALMTRGWKTI